MRVRVHACENVHVRRAGVPRLRRARRALVVLSVARHQPLRRLCVCVRCDGEGPRCVACVTACVVVPCVVPVCICRVYLLHGWVHVLAWCLSVLA